MVRRERAEDKGGVAVRQSLPSVSSRWAREAWFDWSLARRFFFTLLSAHHVVKRGYDVAAAILSFPLPLSEQDFSSLAHFLLFSCCIYFSSCLYRYSITVWLIPPGEKGI
jgi:hypothetical protein